MDLTLGSTTNSLVTTSLTPIFGDNVQDLLGTGALHVNPSAIITVNSIDDALNDINSCVTTLRDAINQANGDTGEDLIVFDRSLFSNAQTITLSQGELDLTHNLDIIAPRDSLTGADLVTVSGKLASRVFEIETGATVSIDGLIVADGRVTGNVGGGIKNSGILNVSNSTISNNSVLSSNGGGIYNSGILTVNNSTISGNNPDMDISGFYLHGKGGGIYNNGTVTVSNSTISGNTTYDDGGGMLNDGNLVVSNSTISGNKVTGNSTANGGGISNSGTMTVSTSTINDNSTYGGRGGHGGGIDNSGTMTVSTSTINSNLAGSPRITYGGGISNTGNLVVSNSTISQNNSAAGFGGGISNEGNLTLLFSTLTLNSASKGGGVFNSNSANVRNTIIASNQRADVSSFSYTFGVNGTFSSLGYNLIGDGTGSTGFGSPGDIVGTSENPIDPRLAPLDFNGGSTQTISLLPDSPAIDAGDPTVLDTDPTTDQRGMPRRAADGSADIGAKEFS